MNAPHLEARRWFQQAQADLAVVRTLRGAGHHAAACFHSQQAAEKALKAFLSAQGARVVLGHSVEGLTQVFDGSRVVYAKGRIGQRLAQLGSWLVSQYRGGIDVGESFGRMREWIS